MSPTLLRGKEKGPSRGSAPRARVRSGGDLRSHTVSRAVSSALKGLTSVFGMGTGVTPSLAPPETFYRQAPSIEEPAQSFPRIFAEVSRHIRELSRVRGLVRRFKPLASEFRSGQKFQVKPHDRLVQVSCARYRASTSCLSTWWSTRGLQATCVAGDLISGRVSRLDAFSVYLNRT